MKKFRTLLCILLAVAMVLSFAACGKKTDDKAPADDAADNAPAGDNKPADDNAPAGDEGGEETPDAPVDSPDAGLQPEPLIMINDVDQVLNRPHEIAPGTKLTFHSNDVPAYTPWNATAEVWLLPNIYEGLNYTYMGMADDLRPLIATEWEASDDLLTWTFQIREGIKFTDGTVCDANAIVESWNYFMEASPASFTNLNIGSWEATGDYEFVVHMANTCPYIESSFAQLYILSPSALAQYGVNDNRSAVGTAPYYVESYTPGVEFVFKANTEYYLYERMPVVETINYKIILDDNTKLMAMLNGDLDAYTFSSVESYYNLLDYNFDGIMMKGNGNASPLFLNAKSVPEFQIWEVRKAFNRFIDFDAINTILYDDMGLVQTSLWTVGSSGEVPWPEGFYYDEAEGLELMAQAGVDPKDFHFAAKIIDTSADFFVTIQGQLNKVGITMDVEPLEAEANFTFMMNGDYTITAGNSGYTDSKPYLPWTFILLPEHLIKEVWTDIYDPDLYATMCDTFYAMTSAATWDDMIANANALTTMLQEDYGAMPGIQSPYFAAFNKDIKGICVVTENHYFIWNYMYL